MTRLSHAVVRRADVCAATTVVRAHHSFSMFDSTQGRGPRRRRRALGLQQPSYHHVIRDAKGTAWGFEGAAPPAMVGRTPKVDGFTFKPGDRVTMIHCPLRDGRTGGAIGLIVTKDGTWYNPADGGCRARERGELAEVARGRLHL